MPKLYDYCGLRVYFYANDHEPVQVHGFFQGRESKAELIIVNGAITGGPDCGGARYATADRESAGGF